ncbi:hypothetical protein LSH36_104g00012 [Paralvinella palmiformis]|uniref:Semaphorin-2A n=1 Tax=Paralvinella palmiformis TaxID=53620 RepID=A0AAD9K0Y3_9ANNE|nr:hypothetical protein LSH36_104g00012 [Paralvinella palmiformis]
MGVGSRFAAPRWPRFHLALTFSAGVVMAAGLMKIEWSRRELYLTLVRGGERRFSTKETKEAYSRSTISGSHYRCSARFCDGITRFQPSPGVKYFRYLNLNEEETVLYIGAMNYVIRINDIKNISSSSYDITRPLNTGTKFNYHKAGCESRLMSNANYECQNHIRAIIPLVNGTLQICGTSAYNSTIYMLDDFTEDPEKLDSKSFQGLGICPPNPNATCNIIYVRNGNPGNMAVTYSGTMMDFTMARPLIYRPKIPGYSKLLRTEYADTKWLNEPYFVQSFDVGDYIYFFFRENAIEYMNCGKAIYSRVARVCKSDRGGNRVLTSRFTTYFKARLNCSIPGNYPFYFNELYDVFRIDSTFYGLFRTYNNGLYGSAVCKYTNLDIETAFNGTFKEQKESTSIWQRVPEKRVPNPRPGSCTNDSTKISDDVLQFSKARPLMDLSVQMTKGHPVFYEQELMYEKMVVLQRKNIYLFILATSNGEIHKVVSWLEGGTYQHKVITVWNSFADNEQIHQMKLSNNFLYLSTDNTVTQISVEQCNKYQYCTQCIQDPDCGWNNVQTTCQPYNSNLVQNVRASIPEKECSSACKSDEMYEEKLSGESVHLDCKSKCEPSDEVQWFFNNRALRPDEKKLFQTVSNSLIIFNLTGSDNGTYTCKSHDVILKQHTIMVSECNDPERCWRHEFTKWCIEFEKYQEQMKQWRCLKEHAVNNEQCFTSAADTCKKDN